MNSPMFEKNAKIQACPGGIYKSHPKSSFIKLKLDSEEAENLLCPADGKPEIELYYDKTKEVSEDIEVVVLQIVNFGEYVIAEYMKKEDYEER